MKKILFVFSFSGILLISFQNCGDAFQAIHTDKVSSIDLSSQVGNVELVSPFAKSKVSLKTFGAGQQAQGGISTHYKDSATVDPSIAMGLVVDNSCALNTKLNNQIDAFGGLLTVDFSKMKSRMKIQVYPAFVKKEIRISQIKTALDKEPCVIGLANDGIAKASKVFADIEKEQDHHRAIKTMSGYNKFFSVLNAQGPEIKVAVIDSGADATHPELKNVIWSAPEGGDKVVDFTSENNGLDGNGHGTHVSGLIAAQFNESLGTAGVANGVKIMALKALSKEGSGSVVNIVNAIFYAIDNNADVINMSLGGGFSLVDDLYLEAFRYAANKNIPVLVAAGNDGQEIKTYGSHPPADLGQVPGIIVVGSVHSSNLERSSFSNYGALIDIAASGSYAPGSCVISTLPVLPSLYGDKYSTSLGYGKLCGTSMATPIATGAAAMVIKALKFKKLAYTSQTIELILRQYSQKGNAPQLGTNAVLDLEALASYLKQLVNLPQDLRGIDLDNPSAKYLTNLFMNILYRKYDDDGMKYYLEKINSKSTSLFGLNKMFIESDEFTSNYNLTGFNDGEKAVPRLFLNLVGRIPTTSEVSKLRAELPQKDGKFASIGDLIATLLVSPEGMTVIQSLKVEGLPVFDEDRLYTSDQITNRQRKRVAAFKYFTQKYNRRPAQAEVQAVSGFLDNYGAQETIDMVFKMEPSDLKSFIYAQYKQILDRLENEVSVSEYNYYKQKIVNNEISRDSFIAALKNSTEKKVRDVFKEFAQARPFKWQVDNAVSEYESGAKTWEQTRASIKSVVENSDPYYISSQVQAFLAKHLLRNTMINALPPFKLTSAEEYTWNARYKVLNNWTALEQEIAALPEAISYRLYISVVGRTAAEIYADPYPVQLTIASLQNGASVASVAAVLESSDEKFLRGLYSSYLLKTPTLVELTRYLDGLKAGKFSRESISNFIQGKSRLPDLTVPTEPTPVVVSNSDFVKAKYKEILDRLDSENAQDIAGLNYWVNLLDLQRITRTDFENSLKASPELALRKVYLSELKRRADFAGLAWWIKEVDAGRATIALVTAEFKKLCTARVTECK